MLIDGETTLMPSTWAYYRGKQKQRLYRGDDNNDDEEKNDGLHGIILQAYTNKLRTYSVKESVEMVWGVKQR